MLTNNEKSSPPCQCRYKANRSLTIKYLAMLLFHVSHSTTREKNDGLYLRCPSLPCPHRTYFSCLSSSSLFTFSSAAHTFTLLATLDSPVAKLALDNFIDSVYNIARELSCPMFTPPGTTIADHFVPVRHLALLTQPVLGARSHSHKKPNDDSSTSKHKLRLPSSARRKSLCDPLSLIIFGIGLGLTDGQCSSCTRHCRSTHLSTRRIKVIRNNHCESFDLGLGLFSSTVSFLQFKECGLQHVTSRRLLSPLNEGSHIDNSYGNEQQHRTSVLSASQFRTKLIHGGGHGRHD